MNRTVERQIPTSAGTVRVRLHNPTDLPRKPALVYLHGGGWTIFSIETHDRLMREYAARSNVVVIGVDYERSPEVRFPTALDQVVGVVRWLRDNASVVDIDPQRIAVGGDSAGGNLTVATCLKLRDAGERCRSPRDGPELLGVRRRDLADSAARLRRRRVHADRRRNADVLAQLSRASRGPSRASRVPDSRTAERSAARLPGDRRVRHPRRTKRRDARRSCAPPASRRKQWCTGGASHSFLEAVSIAALSARALEDTSQWLRATLAQPQRAPA